MRLFKTLFCVLFACTSVLSVHSSDKQWFQIRSPHFKVITDLCAKRGTEVARHCEQMRSTFALLMNRARSLDPAPLLIFALDGQKEVDAFAGGAESGKHAGLFLPGTDESFILVDASGDPWHAVYHEYAHELLNANTSTAVQTWFDEGFAEYFSTLEVTPKETRVGSVPMGDLQFLRQNGKLMRFSDLAATRQDSPTYSQNRPEQAMFYAQSWLLVHYLFDHQLISHAEPFFAKVASGTSLSEATLAEFGMSVARLEADLMAYAKGERFRYFSLPAVEMPVQVTVSALTSIAAEAWQIDVRWHAKSQHSKADLTAHAEELHALLAKEPNNPMLLRQLGLALAELGDHEKAVDVLTRALNAEPAEVLNHYALALTSITDVPSPDSSGALLQRELAACIQLSSDFADVYRLQALVFSQEGLLDKAIAVMHEAFVLAPRSEMYELGLADLELK